MQTRKCNNNSSKELIEHKKLLNEFVNLNKILEIGNQQPSIL